MNMLIMGAGFSGCAIGNAVARSGASVVGTSRDPSRFDALRAAGIAPVLFDGLQPGDDLIAALRTATHLLISIAPPRNADATLSGVDPVLRALGPNQLATLSPKLKWIGYLSTVGVYGNHDGAWVDEAVPPAPVSERSRQRVAAEEEWRDAASSLKLPLAIFRLSGIYGPGRNGVVNAHAGKTRRLIKPGQVFNRIHVADIATAVCRAAANQTGGLFNITDDEPAPPQDVVTFAHTLLGTEPPAEIDFESADLTPMARSFYGENKRVSNAKSKAVLGMTYEYPNYRIALTRMFEEGTWKG